MRVLFLFPAAVILNKISYLLSLPFSKNIRREEPVSIFDHNEEMLEKLEAAESRVEKIRIEGVGTADSAEKARLAAEIKSLVSQLARNVEKCKGDVQKLGGALVLPDLLDVFKRYGQIFEIENLENQIRSLERMWERASDG